METSLPDWALASPDDLIRWFDINPPRPSQIMGFGVCPTCGSLIEYMGLASHITWHIAVLFPEAIQRTHNQVEVSYLDSKS